jgi:hypothetical protein
MDMSILYALICIKLVMVLLEWIRVLCMQRYTSISEDDVWTNMSILRALLFVELIMLLLGWIQLPYIDRHRISHDNLE